VITEYPAVKVIILSMHANEEYVMQALRAGAAGYVLKDSAATELDLALAAVRRGETYLSPVVSRTVIDGYLSRFSNPSDRPGDTLTPRQRQVLKLVAEGRSSKEIAFALDLSVKTVDTHRAQIVKRLGIGDVPGLVRYAIRVGLIPPE
jgi:DNA-binding NarL/FixJ family response regulator